MNIGLWMLSVALQADVNWVVDTYGDWVCRDTDGDCEISMTYHEDERLVHYRSSCVHSLTVHLPAMKAVLGALGEQGHEFDTMFIGRMIRYPEMARRLVEIAVNDEGWAEYRPGSAEAYTWIVESCNRHRAHEELASAFDDMGMRLTVSSVEKVLSDLPENMPGDLGKGVMSAVSLPFDAMTWFKAERK